MKELRTDPSKVLCRGREYKTNKDREKIHSRVAGQRMEERNRKKQPEEEDQVSLLPSEAVRQEGSDESLFKATKRRASELLFRKWKKPEELELDLDNDEEIEDKNKDASTAAGNDDEQAQASMNIEDADTEELSSTEEHLNTEEVDTEVMDTSVNLFDDFIDFEEDDNIEEKRGGGNTEKGERNESHDNNASTTMKDEDEEEEEEREEEETEGPTARWFPSSPPIHDLN